MKFRYYILGLTFLTYSEINSQNWLLGGNGNTPPPQAVNTTNNFLGSNATNNTFMRIGVQGSQDIMIDNNPAQLVNANPVTGPVQQGGHWVGFGRIFRPSTGPGFSNQFNPKAHLHVHGGNNSGSWGFTSGLRNWFNTGTLYTENSDGMYVGLRQMPGVNFSYATINWSDDNATGAGGADFLTFNFTGGQGLSGTNDGAEMGRFSPHQNSGTLGVGNFQFLGYNSQPNRRLEVLDADPTTGQNANRPQLRTTYTYNTNTALGVFTDFQTTSIGDMYFNTRANNAARNFGFHKSNPLNCVEIASQNGNPYFTSGFGSSGLRFTNLRSTNNVVPNGTNGVNYNKVLTVDGNGDVVLIPSSVPTSNNGISINGGVVQLGVPCTTPLAGITANAFTTDRVVANGNQNFWIASLNSQTGGFGVGGQPINIGFCGTGNTMEISANLKNVKYGNNNASGLRFSKLLSTSPTVPNGTNGVNSLKVLTVDSEGDVVLTDAAASANANNGLSVNGGNVQLGGDCGNAAAAALTSNREIPMNGFNLNFTNPANSSSQVLFGFPACNTVSAKLVANNDFHQAGIAGVSTVNSANPAVGVFGQTNNSGSGLSIGVYGLANASGASNAIGVNCEANGGTNSNVGVNGISNAIGAASNLAVNGTARNANILSIAGNLDVENSSSPTNIGHQSDVRFGTNPTSNNFGSQLKVNTMGANNYGVSAEAFGGTVNYAIFAATGASSNQTPPTGPNYAGYFNGDVVRTGTDNFTSDQNLKQNINPINNALSIINQLSPKTFEYKQADYPSMRLPSGIQYGLIAQEVQAILPELVNNNVHPPVFDSVGNIVTPAVNYLSMEYQQFMGILIKAIQEQQKTIDSLSTKQAKQDSINQSVQAQLAALASQINGCCTNAAAKVNQAPSQTQKTIHQMEIELSDKDAIVLEQNVPNPFAEQTTILYNLPTSVGKAQLMFYNVSGQLIKAVDLNTRGNGKLIVFANDLSSGLYHYTLVADGKVIDSKKMVRE